MIWRRVTLFLMLICSFGLLSNVSASFSGVESKLTEEDKAQIVKSVLEQRLSNHKVYPPGRELILSSLNIDVNLIPNPISDIQLSFLKPDEIKKRDKGNIRYLEFGEFKLADSGVTIGLSEIWRDGIARGWSRTAYECRKVEGKWQIEEGEESFEIFN